MYTLSYSVWPFLKFILKNAKKYDRKENCLKLNDLPANQFIQTKNAGTDVNMGSWHTFVQNLKEISWLDHLKIADQLQWLWLKVSARFQDGRQAT